MTTRADIIAEARSWIGTRWHHQAALKGTGTDCIGLIAGVAHALGIRGGAEWFNATTYRGYGRNPDGTMLLRAVQEFLDPVYLPEAQPGDILLLRFAAEPQHFALISKRAPDYMIHAYAQARRVVENRIDAVWRARIVRCYAYRGLDG